MGTDNYFGDRIYRFGVRPAFTWKAARGEVRLFPDGLCGIGRHLAAVDGGDIQQGVLMTPSAFASLVSSRVKQRKPLELSEINPFQPAEIFRAIVMRELPVREGTYESQEHCERAIALIQERMRGHAKDR